MKPTKDLIWFIRPTTTRNGLDNYSFKNPNLYNQGLYTDKKIINAICSRDFFFSLVLPCLYCLIWTMPNRITNIPQIISDK